MYPSSFTSFSARNNHEVIKLLLSYYQAFPLAATYKHPLYFKDIAANMFHSSVKQFIRVFIWIFSPLAVVSFSASPKPSFLQEFSSFFNNQSTRTNRVEQQTLKKQLLELSKTKDVTRLEIENCIAELREVQDFQSTASSTLLKKKWLL